MTYITHVISRACSRSNQKTTAKAIILANWASMLEQIDDCMQIKSSDQDEADETRDTTPTKHVTQRRLVAVKTDSQPSGETDQIKRSARQIP